MYVVGISGTPRRDGNTAILVKEVLNAIEWEKKFITLSGLDINSCRSCDSCSKEGIECVIEDDIQRILKELEHCHAMILGSPCYFKSVSAQLKMLMDRSLSLYRGANGSLRHKVGAAVVTQDVHGWGGAFVVSTIRNFFDTHRVIYAGSVVGEGGKNPGHIRRDEHAMRGAVQLGKRIIELVELTKTK